MRWIGLFAIAACGRIDFATVADSDAAAVTTDVAAIAPHEVQFAKNFNTTNVMQLSVTLPQPTATGDLVVVTTAGFSMIASVDDDAPGGTSVYQGTGAIATDSNNDYSDIWFAPASHAGATTVTVHMSVSNVITLWVAEFAGYAASPLGSMGIGHDNIATTMLTTPGVNVSVPSSLVFVMAAMDGTTVTPLSSTFTDLGQQDDDDVAYLIAQAPGMYTADWTFSPAGKYVTSAAVFAPAN